MATVMADRRQGARHNSLDTRVQPLDRHEGMRWRAEQFGDDWMLLEDAMAKWSGLSVGSFYNVREFLRCRPNSTRARTARGCGLLVHRDDVEALTRVKRLLKTSWRVAARVVAARRELVEALAEKRPPTSADVTRLVPIASPSMLTALPKPGEA